MNAMTAELRVREERLAPSSIFPEEAVRAIQEDALYLGQLALAAVEDAVVAVRRRDLTLATRIIAADGEVDTGEINLQTDCIALLASTSLISKERRTVAAALHIGRSAERIADHAVDIAAVVKDLQVTVDFREPDSLWHMAGVTVMMLRSSLEALDRGNSTTARLVCRRDDEIDELRTASMIALTRSDSGLNLLPVQRILLSTVIYSVERIADLATDIAEQIIYVETGQLQRLNNYREWGLSKFPVGK